MANPLYGLLSLSRHFIKESFLFFQSKNFLKTVLICSCLTPVLSQTPAAPVHASHGGLLPGGCNGHRLVLTNHPLQRGRLQQGGAVAEARARPLTGLPPIGVNLKWPAHVTIYNRNTDDITSKACWAGVLVHVTNDTHLSYGKLLKIPMKM